MKEKAFQEKLENEGKQQHSKEVKKTKNMQDDLQQLLIGNS